MIAPMKKIMLAGRLPDREAVLSMLREAGVVHVEPVYPELVRVSPHLLKQIERTSKVVEFLSTVVPKSEAVASKGSSVELIDDINEKISRLSDLQTEKTDIQKEMERVAPWGAIGKEDIQALREAGLHVEFFLCSQGQEESVEADVRQIIHKKEGISYLVAVSQNPIPPSAKATRIPQPPRDIVELESALNRVLDEEKRISESLQELAARRDEIQSFHNSLLEEKRFAEVETSLMAEGPIFILKGWVPVDSVQQLNETFQKSSLHVGIELTDPEDEETPPTKLQNSWWCRPIQSLYPLLGITPGYHESDISPFFLPFLTIFTAMLFADAGYGLVIFAALALAYKPLTSKGAPKDALLLFMTLFGGVVVYGVLTNTYFGTTFLKLTSFDSMSTEGEYALKKACFFIGALHLSIAHAWKVRKASLDLSILSEIGWLLFIWAMYALVNVLVLGDPQPRWMIPLFEFSLGLVLFFTAPSWNLFLAVAKGLGSIALSAASFLSDIISYIRLWAVGLAGGILAASFNELARPLPIILAILVLIAAHLMNMALCFVAVFAHGVRLNLLEFSNHLGVEWSGREYDPFKKQ